MTVRHWAFGNIGRGSDGADKAALTALRDALPDTQAAIVLAEINEGDRNNELALAQAVLKGWALYGRTTREPVFLSPDQPRAKAVVVWVPDTAVPHWSPRRSWLTVNLADEPVSILSGHPPAGAHGQGDRPAWARPELNRGFDRMRAAKRKRVKHLHDRGRNVVVLTDENDYDLENVHPRVQTVWHDRTDWGQVIPADGWTADFHKGRQVDFHVDSHDGHLMSGRFVRKS